MVEKYPDFSGYYCYKTKAVISHQTSAILEIDDAYECAEVFVNGTSVGTKVTKPYLYDITNFVSGCENEIKIEVATTLARKVRSMGVNIDGMGEKTPLSATGILGNVTVYIR